MKKFLGLLFVCFLLAGCGIVDSAKEKIEKELKKEVILVCSKNTESTVNFVTDMSYYFENDKTVKLGIKYTYDLSAYSEEQRKSFSGAGMCATEAIKTDLGMTDCKEELSGSDYIVEGFSTKLLAQSKDSYSTTKKALESDGWTCTEK